MGQGVLQTLCKAYPQNAQSAVLTPQGALSQQIALLQCRATNKSSGASDVGILRGFSKTNYLIGKVETNVLTDESAAIAAGTASQIFNTTNNDGFMVSSVDQFGLVGFTISTGESGSPVYTYKYWNGAAWTTLPVVVSLSAYAAGYKLSVVFLTPIDWVKGGNTVTGAPSDKYNIWVQSTTAGGQSVLVTSAVVGSFIDYAPSVPQYGSLEWKIADPSVTLLLFKAGEYLLPYFGTAAAGNSVSAQYLVQY